MKYVLRDPRPLREGWTTDPRFASLERVRVNPVDPKATAAAIASTSHCYLQHLYDDSPRHGVVFDSQESRGAYWRRYVLELALNLQAHGDTVPSMIAIEHPRLGWDPYLEKAVRFQPEWQERFRKGIDALEKAVGAAVAQFGVPDNSAVLYESPFDQMMIGSDGDGRTIAWVNLPGQWAFNERTTRFDEFRLAIAYCVAERYETVILWSDPREPSGPKDRDDRISEDEFADVMATIDLLDPWRRPAVEPFEIRPGESFAAAMARLAKETSHVTGGAA